MAQITVQRREKDADSGVNTQQQVYIVDADFQEINNEWRRVKSNDNN